jgi:lipopolysaccharide biosynthesis glycosyltransferase
LEKYIDISKYDVQESRVLGYISEWLFGIFITHKKRCSSCIIKELQRTFLEHTENYNIYVCFSSDNNYVQHLSVAIVSMLKNKDKNDHIHISILDGGISDKNKENILNIVHKYHDTCVEFKNINKELFSNFPIYTIENIHISLAAYYRIVIADLLPFSKVIYLDCDIVICKSLMELYQQDTKEKYILGVDDILSKFNTKRLGITYMLIVGYFLWI